MKRFDNPILENRYVNTFGETLRMVMDDDYEIYIHHNDCTDDFIKIMDFNFIINETEKITILNFIETSTKLVKELHKKY